MNKKQDTGFGISIDVIKIKDNTTTRIVNEWSKKETIL